MRRTATLLIAAAAGWAIPASAAAAPEVDAGALRAQVSADPWHLELTDARGRTVLAESRATSGVAGTLGFRTANGWEHATRVLTAARRRGRYTATLATSDPARTLSVTLDSRLGGVIDLEAQVVGPGAPVEAVGIGFAAHAGERYLGFGERSNAVDQTGNVVESYVADGPYQAEEYPAINLFTPRWGLRDGRPEATYYPVPWLLSTAGYGVLVDDPRTSYFRLRTDDPGAWSVEVAAVPEDELGAPPAAIEGPVAFRFFAGPKPAGALRRLVEATGHQPKPAAPWVLGPWYQADDGERAEVAALRAADAPLSVLQTYTHYLPCGDQIGNDSEPERIASAHEAGLAITTYFNPMICTDYQPAYDEAAAAGALTVTRSGEPYQYRYGTDIDQDFRVSQFDFFTEAGRTRYAALLDEAIRDGYDGWMEDFGEYTPLDSVSDPAKAALPGTYAHNLYATKYHCAAHDAIREHASRDVVRFQRSGWTGAAPCAQVVWGGDPTTAFGFDGLRSVVTQGLSAGMSGIGIYGSDIGGFFALFDEALSPELLIRWVQLGAATPVMRTQANGVSFPAKDRPQVIDPDQIANWRRYAKLHTQLYPYLTAALRTYRRTGMPPMRHLALVYPENPRAAVVEDEFLLGPDLLVAPVLDPGVSERSVYLPGGRWIDFWRSVAYREGSGGLAITGAREVRGRRDVTLPAPLDELPLLLRSGAILPLLPPRVDTLANEYGKGVRGLDTLAESGGRLRLLAFPRGESVARFNEGERLRSLEGDGEWTLAVEGERRRRYRLQASLATLRDPFRPCEVAVDGRELPGRRWEYDHGPGVLEVSFGGRAPALTATAC